MGNQNTDNGPFPKSIFPESVFPRRIFRWMGDNEEDSQEAQVQVKTGSPQFPWETEKDDQPAGSDENVFDVTRWDKLK